VKRRLTKLVVFLLLGAVVNVAVAWGLGYWSLHLHTGPAKAIFVEYDGEEHLGAVYGNTGIKEIQWGDHHFPGMPKPPVPRRLRWAERFLSGMKPAPDGYPPAPTARGFPMVSMACVVDRYWNENDVWIIAARRGILLEPTDQWSYRVIPFHPIWPGFAINTIFYTAILWLLTLGPFTTRRMIRRKRGHCIKCGYDLRETSGGCPECGCGCLAATEA
jgi:hypothetical protein